MRTVRLALAQLNMTVGAIEENTRKIVDTLARARAQGANLVLFPELAISGYPPEDLLLKPDFLEANLRALDEIRQATADITAVVGYPAADDYDIYNAAAVLQNGKLVGMYRKHYLPNYGVFDENRYFGEGLESPVFDFAGDIVGVSICEDIWYPVGPPQIQALAGGAELLANISASPYYRGKGRDRERMLATRAADNVAVVAYCNLVGGQDELVFDGHSLVFGPRGELVARAPAFEEALILVDVDLEEVFRARLHDPRRRKDVELARQFSRQVPRVEAAPLAASHGKEPPAVDPAVTTPLDALEEVYRALVLGTRDYVRKNGFDTVVLGLSGGIDSSLTATIAVDALGDEHVVGVAMPSRFSSEGSVRDARELARNLGIRLLTIPIEPPFQGYLDALADAFAGTPFGVAEENIQARIRGNYLMALSNKFGWLVLTTGNKSESAVGYATLYGDTAGGFAPIKDVFKTLVYELARWRNARPDGPLIPESVLTKPPSAELRPDQKDTDTLPPYDVLDVILELYVERDYSANEIVEQGFAPELVERVIRMVDRAEYKRRQVPPGIKITTRAFGKDRRLPITNRYRYRSR
ncbi:MAG: NAD+ synthase [Ardenticatenia bacterium]|nr:NAD+ synthase [Ardenticatenia bacterium]